VAVAVSLSEVGSLPEEAPLDILSGLSICSVPAFRETFEFQGTEERIRHLRQKHKAGTGATLDKVRIILHEANDLYNALSTAGKWNVAGRGGRVSACWNCGGKHGLSKCRQPKDQKRIDANKKKWQESKKSGGSTNGNSQYERKKWDSDDSNKKGGHADDCHNGVKQINNVWHMHCTKGCGWNTTHTTGFHGKFKANPSAYPAQLPSKHPYMIAVGGAGSISANKLQGTQPSVASTASLSSVSFASDKMVIDKTKWRSVLEQHERNSESSEVAALCSSLKSLLN
jgi:hypothetical protein